MSTAVAGVLKGREEELARLEAFLAAAAAGPAKLVLEGEPGIGKTTLWRAGVTRARELGYRVLEARPAAPERELAFGALGDLLAGVHEDFRGLPAPQRRALRVALLLEEPEGEPPEERALAVATLELLRRLAAEAPLLVALDDLQWLDRTSARVLEFALRRLVGEPVRVLATVRSASGQAGGDLESGERLTVGPLSLQALDQLVRARLGARFLRPTLRQLEQASGGNPFYALELAASLLRSGRQPEPGAPLPVPESLRELLGARLATLPAAARRAALATAALAQPTAALLQEAAAADDGAIAEAVRAGVLVREGETVRVAHPLLASTLYQETSAAERRRLHRRLARLVTEPEERARHLAEAADAPDERVADALEAAAASVAARGAPEQAARLAGQAVELTPQERRPQAHRRGLAQARYVLTAGDPSHAEALLQRQLGRAIDPREHAEVALALGDASFATRGTSAARGWYERALGELEQADDLELRARALIALSATDLKDLRFESQTFEQAAALAEQIGEPALLARALGLYAVMLEFTGQRPSEEYWRRALALEEATGELRIDGPTAAYGGVRAFLCGEHEGGAMYLRRVAASMRRRSDPLLPLQLLTLSDIARNAGNWDEADRYIEEASQLAGQTGWASLAPSLLLYEGRMAMLRGQLEPAREKAEEALRLLEQPTLTEAPATTGERPSISALAHSLLGRVAAQAGDFAEASRRFADALERDRAMANGGWLVEALADDIACLVQLGRLEQASQELNELSELARVIIRDASYSALVARSRALIAAAEGDTDAALLEFQRTAALLEALPEGWPYELARTLLLQGSTQRRARQKLAARATLERALEIFERLGARLWADKARAELRQISGRPGRPGHLTETEQQIAELVALGRSNAEVAHQLQLSPKTVEWNLSKIYRKLHLRSRSELAAKLARQAVPP